MITYYNSHADLTLYYIRRWNIFIGNALFLYKT